MAGNGILIYYLRGRISRPIYDVTGIIFFAISVLKKIQWLRGEANSHLAASECPAFCETARFITVFTGARHIYVLSQMKLQPLFRWRRLCVDELFLTTVRSVCFSNPTALVVIIIIRICWRVQIVCIMMLFLLGRFLRVCCKHTSLKHPLL